eukprot:m.121099 g.121099  ORF g.121099 m.121099 type:complete len:94 (+) comp17265_c0_seq1:369-650(+)
MCTALVIYRHSVFCAVVPGTSRTSHAQNAEVCFALFCVACFLFRFLGHFAFCSIEYISFIRATLFVVMVIAVCCVSYSVLMTVPLFAVAALEC